MPTNLTQHVFEKKGYRPSCPKCKIQFGERVPRGPVVKSLCGWLPLTRYLCYKCKSKYYVIRRKGSRYLDREKLQIDEKSLLATMTVTQLVAEEHSAGLGHSSFISTNENSYPGKRRSEQRKLLPQVNALQDVVDTVEKHDDQILALLARVDDLEQELFFCKNLKENHNFSFLSSIDLDQAMQNQDPNEKIIKNG